jgi:hypothetical protein
MSLEAIDLPVHEVEQVGDVQDVAYLVPLSPEAAVIKRAIVKMPCCPEDEKSLIDLPHLPGPCDHPAAVDDRLHAKGGIVFLDQQFGGELGRAVERTAAVSRKLLGDAARGPTVSKCTGHNCEAITFKPQREGTQRRNLINPARRQKNHRRAMTTRVFEGIECPDQIGIDEIARIAVPTGMDGRLGRALDQ